MFTLKSPDGIPNLKNLFILTRKKAIVAVGWEERLVRMEVMSMEETSQDLLLDTCLLAGKVMMESGAEMYRVEDTMSRIAEAATEKKRNQLCDTHRNFHDNTRQLKC